MFQYLQKTGDIFTGPGVLSLIEAPGRDIKRPLLDQWRVFIQSMYGARLIREGSILLYDTEVNLCNNIMSRIVIHTHVYRVVGQTLINWS